MGPRSYFLLLFYNSPKVHFDRTQRRLIFNIFASRLNWQNKNNYGQQTPHYSSKKSRLLRLRTYDLLCKNWFETLWPLTYPRRFFVSILEVAPHPILTVRHRGTQWTAELGSCTKQMLRCHTWLSVRIRTVSGTEPSPVCNGTLKKMFTKESKSFENWKTFVLHSTGTLAIKISN